MHAATFPCSREQFDTLAGVLARDMNAEMVLSSPGYPAETLSIIGIRPVSELQFSASTTPDEVKKFCFDTPGLALGFVSYTYGMLLRGIQSDKPLDFPLGHLKKYAATIEFLALSEQISISYSDESLFNAIKLVIKGDLDEFANDSIGTLSNRSPVTSLDRSAYEAAVSETLEHILSGHTYQLNLSTKFSWEYIDLNPLALFWNLRRNHPAPFYAWLKSGPYRILSTSPERFIRVMDGQVLSQPIKGTLRVEGAANDEETSLTESPKESAELSMIVDLIRNDISMNCEYGSVRVTNHKSVFRVDNLLQMYSDVHGTLRHGRDCLDLFFDAFPGGSITGCPKRSSMEIIETLEPHSRGMYCGSAVVIRDEQNMDSSIAIRTGVYNIETNRFDAYAGSGIVVDSKPVKEYQETLAKLEKFLTLGDA
jgi:para-aminobenzoate synthetase component 1